MRSRNRMGTGRLWTALAPTLLLVVACGSTDGSWTSVIDQGVINGNLTVENRQGALRVGRGSGVLVDPDVVLTAAHVVDSFGGGGIDIAMEDGFEIVETGLSLGAPILHPTYPVSPSTLPLPDPPPGSPPKPPHLTVGLDLAVLFLDPPFSSEPSGVTLPRPLSDLSASSIQSLGNGADQASEVELFGYGSGELRTMRSRISDTRETVVFGTNGPAVGLAYVIDPVTAPTFQRPEGGDSGGPLAVNDDPATPGGGDGQDATAGIHHGTTDNSGRQGLPENFGLSIAVAGVERWVHQLIRAGGQHFEHNVNRFPGNNKRADHVIVTPTTSGAGPADVVHVEFGEGGRVSDVVPRPSGATTDLLIPKGIGSFLGVGPQRVQSDADVVGLVGGRAMAIFNVSGANATPFSAFLGTATYTDLVVKRLNADAHDDVEATRAGGTDFFFGTDDGLAGPFNSATPNTCRGADDPSKNGGRDPALSNSCGGQSFAGTCWCDSQCAARGDCCADQVQVCGSGPLGLLDDLVQSAIALLAVPPIDSIDVARTLPLVEITAPGVNNLGTFLDSRWIVTAGADLANVNPSLLAVTQKGGGGGVDIESVLVAPDHRLALLRTSAANPPVIPSDHRLDLFSDSDPTRDSTADLICFGESAQGGTTRSLSFPSVAAIRPGSGATEPARLALVETPDLFGVNAQIRPGSPVVTSAGVLAGVTELSRPLDLTVRTPFDDQFPIELTLHEQVSLLGANLTAGDTKPSDRHWLEQVVAKEHRRDANGDGFHDLWGMKPNLDPIAFTLNGTTASATPISAGPNFDLPGNWQLVGRSMVAPGTPGMVWREVDTGELEIWKMDGHTVVDLVAAFVDPSWKLSALGDIDGDEVSDFIWTNDTTDLAFVWLMNSADEFQALFLITNPAELVRFGQWLAPMPLSGDDAFDLVAADHFDLAGDQSGFDATGQEQAAADLVWRQRDGDTTFVWEMAFSNRPCDALGDPLVLADCDASTSTFELSRNAVRLPAQPAHWQIIGTGDYNLDGLSDIAWHARGAGAPPTELGRVQIWITQPGGEFDVINVNDASGSPFTVDPGQFNLSAR